MSTSHTPGPWRPWEGGPSHMVIAEDESTIAILSSLAASAGHDLIGDVGVRQANALLIASAPELLEACQHLLAILKLMPEPGLGEWNWPYLAGVLEQAIAKATGRQAVSL